MSEKKMDIVGQLRAKTQRQHTIADDAGENWEVGDKVKVAFGMNFDHRVITGRIEEIGRGQMLVKFEFSAPVYPNWQDLLEAGDAVSED
jgi:hypothetical protein